MAVADRLELVVVRHGLTAWNREQRYQGQRDIPLLLPEARPDLDRLRDHLAAERFDAVHCSDLTRCRQSLAHVLEGRPPGGTTRFDARLRELDFGDYEGKCYAELRELAAYREWIDSRGEQAPPNGESAASPVTKPVSTVSTTPVPTSRTIIGQPQTSPFSAAFQAARVSSMPRIVVGNCGMTDVGGGLQPAASVDALSRGIYPACLFGRLPE